MNPPLSHPHVLPTGKKRPAIALIIPNTLTALGLSGLLTRMVPHAEIALFHDFRSGNGARKGVFPLFHHRARSPEPRRVFPAPSAENHRAGPRR